MLQYLVYVSYYEIYNEYVYDLLVPPLGKKKRRAALRLGENDGDVFIRDIREVFVENSTQALQVMAIGQKNRKVGCTRSNKQSSRSHCLLTVKVVKLDQFNNCQQLSQITIVDLAGSERSNNTKATGKRLKEAGNINTSLMSLGKCLDCMKWNQSHKKGNKRLIPYRDSKLTRLFKNYFDGKGSVRMIVNISQVISSFDETASYHSLTCFAPPMFCIVLNILTQHPLPTHFQAHVLRFSAMARQVRHTQPVACFRASQFIMICVLLIQWEMKLILTPRMSPTDAGTHTLLLVSGPYKTYGL